MTYMIYTDGACSPDRVGGWAWWHDDQWFDSGAEEDTTNQRMEMMAVIKAIEACEPEDPVHIITDSAYVVNCFHQGWYVRWRKNHWYNSQKQPVANKDLWSQMLTLYESREVMFEHIRGHAGIHGNEMADRLAVKAKKTLQKRLEKGHR